MLVQAIKRGYYKGLREPGGKPFEVPATLKASWFVKAEGEKPLHPLDHDGDGKKGGSRPKADKAAAETEAKAKAEADLA